jgi:hypothetical protein
VKAGSRKVDLAIKSTVVIAIIASYTMVDRIMLPPARFLRVEPQYEVLRGLERTKSNVDQCPVRCLLADNVDGIFSHA